MGTVSGLSGSNPLGFNSDQIVNQIVNAQYGPRIDRLNNRVSQAEDQQTAYQDLNSAVDSFQSSVEDLTDPEIFDQKSASSSNSDVVGASVADENKASQGTSELYVEELATRTKVTSGSFINNQNLVDTDHVGSDGQSATSLSDFEQVSGSETLDPSSDTLDALSNEVQTSGGGMGSGGDGTNEVQFDFNGNGTWDEKYDLDNFDTIGDFMDQVNTDAGGDLEFSYDGSTDQFKIIPQSPGGSFRVDDIQGNITDSSKGFFQQIGIAEDRTIHTFDNAQSEMDIDGDGSAEGRNLLSVDPSKTFDNNLFSTALNSDSGTIQVNNTEIDYDVNSDNDPSTINELVDAIDSDVSGVTAQYDEASDKIRLENENTGQSEISVEDVSGNLSESLNLTTDGTTAKIDPGQDAKVELNGTMIYESSNTFTRNGIEYSLNKEHKRGADGVDGPVSVNVERDTDSVTSEVSDFVDDYNSVIETINENSTVDAPDSPDGEENDSGAFVGSSTARTIKRNLNNIVTRQFGDATQSGSLNNSSNVGIELKGPLSTSQSERGKINFNESTFKEALSDNPEEVTDLFTAEEGNPDRGGDQDGLSVQLNSFAEDAAGSNGFISNRIDGFNDRIESLNERVERQQERASNEQERLQQKYLRLEQQVVQLQQQQSSLGQF